MRSSRAATGAPAWATRCWRSSGWPATAAEFGDPLRAGELVLSGALGPMVGVRAGDTVTVEISGLGAVGAYFGTGER